MIHHAKSILGVSASLIAFSFAETASASEVAQPLETAEAAQAEEESAPAEAGSEIVIVGLRTNTGSRADIKRDTPGIVDGLTSAEIEKLPDLSLAEVLERIAGVNGVVGFQTSEVRTVTVRGFDARYNSFSIDGNPIWNSSRNNRGTQLDVFPTSVVNQVNVHKAITPDQDANSIGAHVELRTLRAFDGGGKSLVSGRLTVGTHDQNSLTGDDRLDYRFSVVGKTTFGDGRFGVVLGAESQNYRLFDQFNEVTGYIQTGDVDVVSGSLFRGLFQHRTRRTAVYGKLEAGATNDLYGFVSLNYFRQQDSDDSFRGGVFLTPTRVTNVGPGTGTFTNAPSEVFLQQYELDRKTILLASGLDYRTSDRGALNLRASYTRYENDETTFSGERFQLAAQSGTYEISRTDPAVTLTPNANISDPARYIYRTGRDAFENQIPHEDEVLSLRLDYSFNNARDANGFGFKTGVYLRRLDRVFDQTRLNYRQPTGSVFTLANVLDPRAESQNPTGTGAFVFDAVRFWSFVETNGTFRQDDFPTADYQLVEDVAAGHGEIVYNAGGFHALVGFRIEHTRFTNENGSLVGTTVVPVTNKFDYTEFLPNAHLIYDLTDSIRARVAYTETLARPDFVDFAFGTTVTEDANGNPVIRGTNPFLQPRTARAFDLSLEWYLPNGLLSAGVFRKELSNDTFTQLTETRDVNGLIIRTETIPLNSGSSNVTGIEANIVIDRFEGLPQPLDGFGFSGNYTFLDGAWDVVFTNGSRRTVDGLRNQPRWIANLTATYVTGPIDAALAYRAQGRTFTGSFGTTAAGDIFVDRYDRLDLQMGFQLTSGVKLVGEIRNLTDSFRVQQTGIAGNALQTAIAPGRSWNVGVRAKF